MKCSWCAQPSCRFAGLVVAATIGAIPAAAANRPLWQTVAKAAVAAEAIDGGLAVNVNPSLLIRGSTSAESVFDITLPDGVAYSAVVESTRIDRPDRYVSRGRLLGQPFSDFLFIVDRGQVGGVISAHPATRYQVLPTDQPGIHRITGGSLANGLVGGSRLPDPKMLKSSTAASTAPSRTPSNRTQSAAVAGTVVQTPPLIDVLIVYTPRVLNGLGGQSGARMAADLCIEVANEAYQNSGCLQRVRLAYAAEVQYTESGSASTDLDALTRPSDGLMDNVIPMREAYRADLVHLLTGLSNMSDLGWLNNYSTFNETWTFSVSLVTQLQNDAFTRAIGSNQGLDHDWHTPSGAVYPYSFGYAFVGNSGTLWGTVMSNVGSARLRQHSNPNLFFDGQPTGQPVAAPQPAYAALSLDNTATTIAAIFDSTNVPPPVISSANATTGLANTNFTFPVTATNGPTLFGAAGLPANLTIDSYTGVISGIPLNPGQFNVDLSASNAGGTGQQLLTIAINSTTSCPLQNLLRQLKPLGIIPPGIVWQREGELLDGARRFRDRVLSATPEGRTVIDAYYRQGPKLFAAVCTQPELIRDLVACWNDLAPALESARPQQPLSLASDQSERVTKLLQRLEAIAEPEARDAMVSARRWMAKHTAVRVD